jgi:hypothetical protein
MSTQESTPRLTLWRTDTRALIGGVLLGVLMVLVVGMGDRVDAVLSGGAFPIFGGIAWAVTMALSALLFGLPGALIAGEIQALMDVALGVPLAPAFFIANAVGPLVFILIAYRAGLRTYLHYLLALLLAIALGNLCVGVYLVLVLQAPVSAIALSLMGVTLISTAVSLWAVPSLARAIQRSHVLER